MLNAIIIEDDIAAEANLRFLLTKYCEDDIRILASVSSGQKGIGSIDSLNPDLVFLDIYLGDMTAYELLERIRPNEMQVIFTTSYDHDSVRHVRNHTVDYLQKPIAKTELMAAVARAQRKIQPQQPVNVQQFVPPAATALPANQVNPFLSDKIALTTSEGLTFVKILSIVHCESERANTIVTLESGEKVKVFKPISQLEELLHGYPFFRVHPFHLINTQRIQKYLRADGGQVLLENGTVVPTARNTTDEFLSLFVKF